MSRTPVPPVATALRVILIVCLVWVSATTRILVILMFDSGFGRPFNRERQPLGVRASYLLIAASPVSGAMLEVFGSRFAKWINLGFWLLFAAYYLVGAVLNWSDPFGPLVLVMGIVLLIPAGINFLLYRGRGRQLRA